MQLVTLLVSLLTVVTVVSRSPFPPLPGGEGLSLDLGVDIGRDSNCFTAMDNERVGVCDRTYEAETHVTARLVGIAVTSFKTVSGLACKTRRGGAAGRCRKGKCAIDKIC